MKKLSMLLIVIGLIFISFGGYQLVKTNKAQQDSLSEAEALLTNETSAHPKASNTKEETAKTYMPKAGDTVGILYIPRLNSDLPIVEGTDEDELERGVGHYKGTAYPLQKDQIVLSGHRDTVFRRMGELELGDILTVELPYGDFSYEIVDTKVVDANDRTIIKSTAPKEVLTVTTCYPFTYIGNAPDRYIITALPVES
ncbi:class D sortase [Virgibacillus oceani]|uniref:Sortase n=1 Tax=Virgibacillus oceani TaxID=1479511 RepID=A0A917LZ77_9BACI|nr:class D sortase [Virgibacillus oceani]GGG67483.1 hypothetical protein GCM10011398_09070 [Virgibacillus oceani]